ncbi:amidase family protein [Streptomyces chiangmaiensis]|uniref:Amidase family protein n=1 Tax=Streptomyces chiangmaiensis TaxID=766497 RepID=A0ABU7FG41_9ACTN|nr:amidase family protein [Streptomyces chiangmaiensis]MED7822946.1 amidase family protein [Streptomyces chiangmaiensis]
METYGWHPLVIGIDSYGDITSDDEGGRAVQGYEAMSSALAPSVVGFKPTARRIPIDGVIANAPTLDTIGVFAATLSAAAVAAAVLCDGWQPVRDTERKPPVLGVPDGPYLEQVGAKARAAFEAQVAALSSAGLPVQRCAGRHQSV